MLPEGEHRERAREGAGGALCALIAGPLPGSFTAGSDKLIRLSGKAVLLSVF